LHPQTSFTIKVNDTLSKFHKQAGLA
jgi:hypothetical protein